VLLVIVAAIVLVSFVVGTHLVALNMISAYLHKRQPVRHDHIGLAVIGAIFAHLVEIWVFSIAIRLLLASGHAGHFEGSIEQEHRDFFYLSAATYTSLGSEILPRGDLRVFLAVEAITGLVLITWTASFLFLVMQRNWEQRRWAPKN
jgi:hypothetical protein